MPTESQLQDSALRARIRERIDTGRLPVLSPGSLQAGYGSGSTCDACDQPITWSQVEYEIGDPRYGTTLKFHLGCHALWHLGCTQSALHRGRNVDPETHDPAHGA